MSKKHVNPYRDGTAYNKIFGYIQKKQVVTRQELLAQKFLVSDVTVILSPRKTSKRGDCRGNFSAQGHLYFFECLAHAQGEYKKFRLRWRETALPRRDRNADTSVEQKVVAKTEAVVKNGQTVVQEA